MKFLEVKDFSLEHTLKCGQYFLFDLVGGSFEVLHRNNRFLVRQESDKLFFENISEKNLIELFSLDLDLQKFRLKHTDTFLLEALEEYWGLRIMKQDLWQCIVTFVCSAAANMEKIKMNLNLLCDVFGENGNFPVPGSLEDLEKLKSCKVGYRAKFLFEINEIVKENPNFLSKVEKMNYEDSKRELMKLPGVGEKVANCICLFSLAHVEAFPVDTWIAKALKNIYGVEKKSEIDKFIEKNFSYMGKHIFA